jgi:hypothetical protein
VTSIESLTVLVRPLSAGITGGHGSSSPMTDTPTWSPGTKIAATYLAPYLDAYGLAARRNV